MRKLETFDAVVKELGGTRALAAVCGRSRNVVFNWRRELNHRFPARHYRKITDALVKNGAVADDRLWAWSEDGSDKPEAAEAAA
jgi:hypothetical protein